MGSKRDSGSFSVELAMIFPAFLFISAIVLVAGSIAQGHIDVQNAAQEAARAATLERDPGAAAAVGRSTGMQQISDCDGPSVAVDTSNFQAGGSVTVTVRCTVNAPLGQSRQMSATATEVIDTYRGDP